MNTTVDDGSYNKDALTQNSRINGDMQKKEQLF